MPLGFRKGTLDGLALLQAEAARAAEDEHNRAQEVLSAQSTQAAYQNDYLRLELNRILVSQCPGSRLVSASCVTPALSYKEPNADFETDFQGEIACANKALSLSGHLKVCSRRKDKDLLRFSCDLSAGPDLVANLSYWGWTTDDLELKYTKEKAELSRAEFLNEIVIALKGPSASVLPFKEKEKSSAQPLNRGRISLLADK